MRLFFLALAFSCLAGCSSDQDAQTDPASTSSALSKTAPLERAPTGQTRPDAERAETLLAAEEPESGSADVTSAQAAAAPAARAAVTPEQRQRPSTRIVRAKPDAGQSRSVEITASNEVEPDGAGSVPSVEAQPAPVATMSQGRSLAERGLNRPVLDDSASEVPLGLLPSGVEPLSYVLELTVDPAQDRFAGRVDIEVSFERPSQYVFLHGKDLQVDSVVALMADGEEVAATYSQVHDDGVARVDFEDTLQPGVAVLRFEYTAAFGRLLHGLYKVRAGDHDYAFTQMESVYARQAFPSFDEPAFKTPFDVTLIVRQEHEAIANMPQIESKPLSDGFRRVRFEPSPPMTTYLFAIAVGPLEVVDAGALPPNEVRKTPLPFRGVAIAGKGDELAYALEETGPILTAMERYFDLPYPYAKLDIIAVPDFDAGAMENIGAITFREKLLLLKEDAPPQQKRAYASVMAHELAHMWFGNLVTMPWWDDIWLNESFATWMSYKAVQAYDPEHHPYVSQRRRTAYAMEQDGLISARQIREPVADNDDIVAAFDGITYSKGGAVLTMFEKFVGEEKFRQGIRQHMTRFAHGSATVYDLIDSLSSAAGRDLAPAADTFLFQSGVPLVEAALDCERNSIELSQSRYLPLGSKGDPERAWVIPVCYKLGSSAGAGDDASSERAAVEEQCLLLSEQEQSVPLEGECPDWLLPNADFAGYYHWLMPGNQYASLLASEDKLSEFELLSVADSAAASFTNGRIDLQQTWAVVEQLAQSDHPGVARSMLSTVNFVSQHLLDTPGQRWSFRRRANALYTKMQADRAFDADFLLALEDNETRIHYSNVASFMAEVAFDERTRRAALDKARDFLNDQGAVASVSRSTLDTVLTVAVQDGGQALVDRLLARFHQSDDAWFRDLALSAMARSRDLEFGKELRELALSDSLRSNEIRRLLLSHLKEDVNVLPTWNWLQDNLEQLAKRMPARHVGSLAQVAVRLCDTQYRDDIDTVFRPILSALPGGERKLDGALEGMELCVAKVTQHGPAAAAYFSDSGDASDSGQ